jgi:concanavalin A-like lectin/glucanase superfamily protein
MSSNDNNSYLYFDGQDDYIEIPDNKLFSVSKNRGGLTVSAWIRPDTLIFPMTEGSGYVHWLGKGETKEQEWVFRMYSQGNTEKRDNRISFYLFNINGGLGVGSYFQEPIIVGEWIHIVGVADSQRTYIYKNGAFKKCDQYQGSGDGTCGVHYDEKGNLLQIYPQHGNAPLRIGTRDMNSFFQGAIREVRIWNRPLSPDEVSNLHNPTGIVPQDGLIAEYLLAHDIAKDTIGNNDGFIHGAIWQ